MTASHAFTEKDWAELLLRDIGAPVTTNNVNNIMRWMTAEEPTTHWWDRDNPLNSGADTSSVSGLGTYANLATAAAVDAGQIKPTRAGGQDSAGYYQKIYQALMDNASVDSFASAVMGSPWASSHYADDPLQDITAPSGSTAAPGGAGTTTLTAKTTGGGSGGGGLSWNPVTDLKNLFGDAESNMEKSLAKVGLIVVCVGTGAVLVVAGVTNAAKGTQRQVTDG